MSVAEKLIEVANKIPLVYSAGEAKHTSRYATALVTGDGTTSISFDCPFDDPDYIAVQYHGADASSAATSLTSIFFDMRTFACYGGFYLVRMNSTNLMGTILSKSRETYFIPTEGVCTVKTPGFPYIKGCQYICTAVKYTDKSDRELLEEELSLLEPTGGTLYYSEARVASVMTKEEFEALMPEGRTYGWEIPK